jgi:hypothetical protein
MCCTLFERFDLVGCRTMNRLSGIRIASGLVACCISQDELTLRDYHSSSVFFATVSGFTNCYVCIKGRVAHRENTRLGSTCIISCSKYHPKIELLYLLKCFSVSAYRSIICMYFYPFIYLYFLLQLTVTRLFRKSRAFKGPENP